MPVDQPADPDQAVSARRLRLGVVLLLIWFIPFWAAAPWIARTLGWSADAGVKLGIAMSLGQTLIGIVGAVVAGKDATALVRGTPFKKVPARAWRIIWTGEIES